MKYIKFVFALACGVVLSACGDSSPLGVPATPGGGDAGPPPVSLGCTGSVAGHKQAYFGDLHVHSSYSLDAYTFNAINGPREAYRFAKGEPGGIPGGNDDPYTQVAETQLDRPLDFTAVTDHAEFIGGWYYACEGGPVGLPQGNNPACEVLGNTIRGNIRAVLEGSAPVQVQLLRILTADVPTSLLAWADEKRITDEEYVPCSFSTIHAYEYTADRGTQMLHRNVFFLGDKLPLDVFPATTLDYPPVSNRNVNDDWRLFDHLKSTCSDKQGCQVFTIPHNSNFSTGRMFLPREPGSGVPIGRDGAPMTVADAGLRASMDRAVEIVQHKGASECSPGLEGGRLSGEETSCDFELVSNVCHGGDNDSPACALYCKGEPTDPAFCHLRDVSYAVEVCQTVGPDVTSAPGNCVAPLDMVRNALSEGLAIKLNLAGINPYKLAIVAATDTHNGTPGNVSEKNWPGHGGVLDNDPRERLGAWFCDSASENPSNPNNCTNRVFLDYFRAYNPGGITGVWTEENTRDQIWHGIHRGETFGTSGPRMRLRTIATWQQPPAHICDQLAAGKNPVDTGEIKGALMGGDLPAGASSGGPWVVAWAMQDPGGNEPGLPLQRLDIIKGTVGDDGEPKIRVFEGVARTTEPVTQPSSIDCSVNAGRHPEQLCSVWKDPEFNASHDAFYYARALEIPSCRWDAYMCTAQHVDCSKLDPANGVFPKASGMQGYEGCCLMEGTPGSFHGRNHFHTIEERAWASPIWYDAAKGR